MYTEKNNVILGVSVQSTTIKDEIQSVRCKIASLPPTEFNYYLNLLLASIWNDADKEDFQLLLLNTDKFVDALQVLFADPLKAPKELAEKFDDVVKCLDELVTAALPHRSKLIIHILSNILGVFCGLVSGVFFGVVGAAIGIIYGLPNPLSGGWFKSPILGMISGLLMGFLVGYRAPSKVFMEPFTQKMDYCIKSLERLGKQLAYKKSHDDYYQETKQYILDTFYNELPEEKKDEAFMAFLNDSHQFQVCTTTAGHISRQLKGFMGHHSFIRFRINGKADVPIEFGGRNGVPNFVDQYENPRSVSGQKLYDMLVLDRILQETHAGFKNGAIMYELGSNDCRTYTDKILLGTGQDPTMISRFSQSIDKNPGYKIVRPMVSFFSRTREDELHCFIENKDDPKFLVKAQSWREWHQSQSGNEQVDLWSGWNQQSI